MAKQGGRLNPADENPYRGNFSARAGNPADVSPYRNNVGLGSDSSRNRLLNPADQSPYRSAFNPAGPGLGSDSSRNRMINPADQSPYRSSFNPAAAGRNPADESPYPRGGGGRNPADESPYRGGGGGAGRNPADESPYRGSTGSLARRRARPPPLETVTPNSPVAPMPARKTAPGRETNAPPRKAPGVPTESLNSSQQEGSNNLSNNPSNNLSNNRSNPKALEMSPAEVRLHAENAQAIARLHAEHSQRIAQLLMGTIECRPTDEIEGSTPEVLISPKQGLLCAGCCGSDQHRKALGGGPSLATMQARRQQVSRLNALHENALATQETKHQRQLALLQVDTQRKDFNHQAAARTGSPAPLKSPLAPLKDGAPLNGKAETRRSGLFPCCGRGPYDPDEG